MCDVRVAAEAARFSHPELSFGDVVYGPLHDLVGGSVARDLCLTGRTLEAMEARHIGFVSAVVPEYDLPRQARETAKAIARAPRDVLLRTKAKFIRRASVVTGNTLDL
jgi:enoyl-CoA hydratase